MNFPAPTVTGGVAPISVVCTPPSGSSFSIGTTQTSCVATDSRQKFDRCTFSVTVESTPVLSVTRFVAFGDSITEGKLADGNFASTPYPAGVQQRLAARYTSQQFTVFGEGGGGETTSGGVSRLPGVLNADNPEALLLLEGVNDLPSGNAANIGPMITNLRTMIGQAQGRGIRVFLATLPPEIAGAQRAGAASLIVPANDQIRSLAGSAGATLVDIYQAMVGNVTVQIGPDGLHPTETGYQTIAQTFFDAIRLRLETSPTLTLLSRPATVAGGWRGE